jgi:hypothetical protein
MSVSDTDSSTSSQSLNSDCDNDNDDTFHSLHKQGHEMQHTASVIGSIITAAAYAYAAPLYDKQPYHTSALTGDGWVQELINGHPKRIQCELGVHKHVFSALVESLRRDGFENTKNIRLEEQLAIFLYASVTGLSTCHLGERFQHSVRFVPRRVLRAGGTT